jgi:AcrR family transcriptional regulator
VTNPSDVPVREPGTRARSGNAMGRTRTALLTATAECVARYGIRKTTMVDVASKSGVAKATLYNHFRTKDDLLDALVLSSTERLTAECSELAGAGLTPALEHAGSVLGASGPLRRVAADEPALLAALGAPGQGRLWETARRGVETVLRESGAPSDTVSVDVVLRWLCGHVMWAATPEELALGARLITAGLGRAPEPATAPPLAEVTATVPAPYDAPRPAGVGWPT